MQEINSRDVSADARDDSGKDDVESSQISKK